VWPIAILFGLFFFVRALLAFFHLSSIFEVHGVVHLHATRPRAAHGVGQIVTFFAYRPPTP
jgi:hypothetical protein